jgi:YgiT-type zinc finger domain-containing protein
MMPCSFCDGELEERNVQYEYRREGNCFVFEDVPTHVCRQRGEKYYDARVVKAMERAVLNQLEPKRILQVPVFSYPEIVAA